MGIQAIRNNNPSLLVNSIFRNQSCFQTENASFSGFYGLRPNIVDTVSQFGTFSSGLSSIGIEQGIVLTTGRVSTIEGQNSANYTSFLYNAPSSDPDLRLVAGNNSIFDAVSLEFDFVPTTNSINFDYVFASEEYCEGFNNNNADVLLL
ncbi:MAG: hypothetical protein HC821_01060 [Lewinella sp.]|nr:hypothetical protein [Lewinella sp.]